MKMENYFEFLSEGDIRVKGSQIGIETILEAYLAGAGAEEIAVKYRILSLEQIYATITYYLRHQAKIETYLAARQTDHRSDRTPAEFSQRLRERVQNYQRTVIAEDRADYGAAETDLESYFDFLSEADIHLKGTRVGIETVLDDYLEGSNPEEIAARYRSPTLEQVYATITYYLRNRKKIDAYMEAYHQYSEKAYQESKRNPSEVIKRLRRLKEQMAQTTTGG